VDGKIVFTWVGGLLTRSRSSDKPFLWYMTSAWLHMHRNNEPCIDSSRDQQIACIDSAGNDSGAGTYPHFLMHPMGCENEASGTVPSGCVQTARFSLEKETWCFLSITRGAKIMTSLALAGYFTPQF